MHSENIKGRHSAKIYAETVLEVTSIQEQVRNLMRGMDVLAAQLTNLQHKLSNLERTLIDEQNHPYSLLVDRATAEQILKDLAYDHDLYTP